jgi:hypothetical protein
MLLLTSTSDIVRVNTGQAADLKVHSSWVDNASGVITPGRTNTATITTATTTTVVGSPGASTQRNVKLLSIRNTHAAASNAITVEHYDGTNAETLWAGTLQPGEAVVFGEHGVWTYYDPTGAVRPSTAITNPRNTSVADQLPTAGTDTILLGSLLSIPSSKLKVGSRIQWTITMTKGAVGTVASTFNVRLGTTGTTADTSLGSLSTGTATANSDTGRLVIELLCRGPLSSVGIFDLHFRLTHAAATTGLINVAQGLETDVTSAAFDVTLANLIASVSFTGGTAAAWTFKSVMTESFGL